MEGVIKKIVAEKGYGFIEVEGKDKDLFFHSNDLIEVDFDSLQEGDKVTFEVAESQKGESAVEVKKA